MELQITQHIGLFLLFNTLDPRYASYEDCIQIFEAVINAFDGVLNDKAICENLNLLAKKKFQCIDYRGKILDGQIHRHDNVYWMWMIFLFVL